jgi:hypothetical protein
MTSMPWRTACLTEAEERAWAATRLPRRCASCTAIATSSSLIQVVPAGDDGVKLSPERLSLTESTPYLRNMRTALRISSGPLTTTPKLNSGYGMCGSVSSPRPPATVISWLAAR